MHKYTRDDFMGYYGRSFLLHPTKNTIVTLVGAGPQPDEVALSDNSFVKLQDLDWKHVQTPRLGYRTWKDGRALYHVVRHAGRRREKGVMPAAIVIDVPYPVSAVASQLGAAAADEVMLNKQLTKGLAEQLFNPTFTSMRDAVDGILNKPHAIGYALSNDWAVSLGLYKDTPLVLHFKGARVASSVDGRRWTWYDNDAKFVFTKAGVA